MATLAYSRKKRQLKQLSDKLHTALLDKQENQDYIQKLISKIKTLLNELKQAVSVNDLKKALGAVAIFFGIAATQSVSAQTFAAPVANPFGLDSTVYNAIPAFADLDGDGDMDLLVAEYYGGLQYFKNTGNKTTPQFAAPVSSPFGISATTGYFFKPEFADLDGDGDMDLMLGEPVTGNLLYLQNTGSKTSPAFAAAVSNPFGLTGNAPLNFQTIVDLDGDGDLDILSGEYGGGFKYYQNTGTKTAPMFAAPVSNPFGLSNVYYFGTPSFADLDNDGDMDLLVGEYYGDLQYFENTGSKTAPAFAAPVANPFGLSATYYYAFPAFADLDGDGDLDLLVGEYYGVMQYFKNTSPGIGLSETPAFELAMYPNPATTYFDLTSNTEVLKVEIMDAAGKVVSQQLNPSNRISVDGLPGGTYLVKVYNRDEQAVIQKLNKF